MATRTILEKAIVHLLNGEQEKAEALFHKFMVERARGIHESLRQDETIELGENWDNEIKEEEYFDDSDMGSEEDDDADVDMDTTMDNTDTMGDDVSADEDVVDDEEGVDDDLDNLETDVGDVEHDADEEGHEEIGDKLENLEDKIDELTAEFDRLMSELEDDQTDMDDSDFGEEDLDADNLDDVEGEEPSMEDGEESDLGDRMEDDVADEDEVSPEEEPMEGVDMDDEDMLDEELADITESIVSELEKITKPSNSDGREIGSGGKSDIGGNKVTAFPEDAAKNVNDRIKGAKPYMVGMQGTGGNFDSMERQPAPAVKPVETVVKGVSKNSSRKSWKDGVERKSKDGDASAALNSNYAGSEVKDSSPISGKKKPVTR